MIYATTQTCNKCGAERPPMQFGGRILTGPCEPCARAAGELRRLEDENRAKERRARLMARVGVPDAYRDADLTPAFNSRVSVRVSKALRRERNPGSLIVIEAPPQQGKTYHLCALALELNRLGQWVRYLSLLELTRMLKADHKSDSYSLALDLLDQASTVPVLCLDDVQEHMPNAVRDAFVLMMHTRYQHRRRVVLATGMSRQTFERLMPPFMGDMLERSGEWVNLINSSSNAGRILS